MAILSFGPQVASPGMGTKMTSDQIREAVRECLTLCLASDTPLDVMANCVNQLRSKGWGEDDAHTVERVVIKVLSRMIEWPEEMIDDLSDRTLRKHHDPY